MRNFKNLEIWTSAMDLVVSIYDITQDLPKHEKFGLSSQIRRAAVSVPSNIAEGCNRGEKEFSRYLHMALGSSFEMETQLILTENLNYVNSENLNSIMKDLLKLQRQTHAFILVMKKSPQH